MELPDHIADKSRSVVAGTGTKGFHVNCEAARQRYDARWKTP
jgi:hypothetical protein